MPVKLLQIKNVCTAIIFIHIQLEWSLVGLFDDICILLILFISKKNYLEINMYGSKFDKILQFYFFNFCENMSYYLYWIYDSISSQILVHRRYCINNLKIKMYKLFCFF